MKTLSPCYPSGTFEEKVGFDTIRTMLVTLCRNAVSQGMALGMRFLDDLSALRPVLASVEEYRRMLTGESGYPDPVIHDIRPRLEQIEVPGSWFEPEELPEFDEALTGIQRYVIFFSSHNSYPHLAAATEGVEIDPGLVSLISGMLDDEGQISDSASEELTIIRRSVRRLHKQSEQTMRRILKEAITSGIVTRETAYTVKNGRFVIPVPSSRKRQLRGYVHDESGTGQTLYIEPGEVLEIFNEIRELELAERREVIRILKALADKLRPHIPALIVAMEYAGLLDFIRAKAKLAIQLDGVMPELISTPMVNWKSAQHPLLARSLREQNKKVVPLDIHLHPEERILIISGPNAGGKSVCLKTMGLLQYMLQCGMLIPVNPVSQAGLFKTIFIDIGDQQSIENDLSTYSSHLVNLSHLLQHADGNTLFLIDEMGSGTEPVSGGAIAEAALELIAPSGAYGVVTTHYANLKLLAGRVNGVINGAMLFDTESMQPLYLLRTGKPGSSFAFEIAANTGMPDVLLDQAREKVGKAHYEFDIQMQQLEVEQEQLAQKEAQLKVADSFVAEMIEKYTRLYGQLNAERKEILLQARSEAKQIVSQSNRLIEKAIKEIKEAGAAKEKVKEIRNNLTMESKKLTETVDDSLPLQGKSEALKPPRVKKPSPSNATGNGGFDPEAPLQKGDWVTITGHGSPGEVLSLDGKKIIVGFGSVKMTVKRDQVQRATPPRKQKTGTTGSYKTVLQDINNKSSTFKPETDLRGMRSAEAIGVVSTLIDDALLLSHKELRILHGKGDGILRQVIRQHLETISEVSSFQDEHIERGGHGVTIVRLR